MMTRSKTKQAQKQLQTYTSIMSQHSFTLVPAGTLWSDSNKFPTASTTLNGLTAQHSRRSNSSQSAPDACMRHLMKETTSLASFLPCQESASIFVCAEEGSLNGMKIFITGPSETPYAYGLFEFNAYFPQTYPQTAPNLKFLTTNNGRVRFNPNLYDTGYVCLSLLDTWSGSAEQRWQAGKSTLMQVLVSVQSIVLVDKPYFNEPGFDVGRSGGIHSASESYNRRVELDTVRHAILEPLKHPPQYAGFDKVIRAHFYLVQERIKKQVRVWADKATKDSQQKVQEWEQLVKEVDKELAKLKPPST